MELFEKLITVYMSNRRNPDIDKLLLNSKVKKAIMNSMSSGMSDASMNNHLMQLRQKGVLVNGTFSDFIKRNLPFENISIRYHIHS